MSFYRVVVRVPDLYVERFRLTHAERTQPALLADIEGRLLRLATNGSGRVLTIIQDTTGPLGQTLFTAIGEWQRPPTALMRDDVLQIVRVEQVEAPPPALTREGTQIPWDSGLLPDEITMVENALLTERNPRHLHGIAHVLEPYFPAAASILDAKGDLVEQKVLMDRSAARELERAITDYRLTPQEVARIKHERERLAAYLSYALVPEMVAREEVKRGASSLIDPNGKPAATFPAGMPLASLLPRTIAFQGRKLSIICPYALAEALPPSPEDGALNETAVQLALGAQKPQMSMIAVENQIPGRLRLIEGTAPVRIDVGRPLSILERKVLRARANLERARQAIERRRWVDWYRRRERGGYTPRSVGTGGA